MDDVNISRKEPYNVGISFKIEKKILDYKTNFIRRKFGEVPEWFKGHAWKACVRVTVPRVRIPASPK
jgi:hypothetical protein